MITFLFWNIAENPATYEPISRLVSDNAIDIVLLAESATDTSPLLSKLSSRGGREYRDLSSIFTKIRLLSHLPENALKPRFTSLGQKMTIWRLRAANPGDVLLALAHLPAKTGGVQDADQQLWSNFLAQDIVRTEDDEHCPHTILVGDINMNPFDPGMVNVMGVHGVMTRDLAGLPERMHLERSWRRFYNPMWGLFGDRTPGAAGSFFWNSSVPSNQHWHIFDQLLLRPSLMNRLISLRIADSDGYDSLLVNGKTSKERFSDHLPLIFSLDI